MPKKGSTSKSAAAAAAAALEAAEEETGRRREPQQPDIIRQEPPLPLTKLRRKGSDVFDLIGFILSVVLGVILVPLLGGVVLLFVILPRIVVQTIIWLRYRSDGVHLLPIGPSTSAAGYEFYTVVLVLSGECESLSKIRAKFQSLISAKDDEGQKKYPGLYRRLVKRLGFHCYEKREHVEVSSHVNIIEEDPTGLCQSRLNQLLQADFKYECFKVMRADAPQWEALVIPRYKYDVQVADEEDGLVLVHQEMEHSEVPENAVFHAIAFRAHSAVLDKQEAFRMFKEDFMDKSKADKGPSSSSSWTKQQQHSKSPTMSTCSPNFFGIFEKIVILCYTFLLTPYVLLCHLCQGSPFSFGEYKTTSERKKGLKGDAFHLHSTRTMSLRGIQSAKNVSRTSVLSIFASCVGGAARNMLLSLDKRLPTQMRFSIKQFSTSIQPSTFNCILPSDTYAYPIDRLGHSFYTVSGNRHDLIRHQAKKWIASVLLWIIGAVPAHYGKALYKRLHNVHILLEVWDLGPRPFHLFGGDLVVDLFAWNGIDGTWADFGVTMVSYSGRVKANIIGDQEVLGFGSRMRKNILADEFLEEYTQIAMPCDIKPKYLYKPIIIGSDELF